jgi:CheY-like chemotaxis protein
MQAALLRRPLGKPERRSQKRADAIKRAANHMDRLIQDLLDVASMEAGRLSIARTRVDVGKALSELAEAQTPLASSRSLELRLDVAPELGEIFADRDRLVQVLENLVGNALKFTKSGGSLTVGAAPRNGELFFWVKDTGAGIASEDVPHLFDRFWQTRKAGQGVGLGLPIVKGIVEAHGGRIWVESQVGAGTTFFFTLPLADCAVPSSDRPTAEARPPAEIVLIADDDADAREALCETLEHAGYDVATAANGAEALAYLHREAHPFLVILDLGMPVMDGWAFLAERNRDPDLRSIPVIVVSGEHDVEDRVAAAHARYVPKPILVDSLLETMKACRSPSAVAVVA